MPAKKKRLRSTCPLANALDILGDRWTLLVLRDLVFYGKREFNEFLNGGEGIATNVLAERLERLCCSGLVTRHDHPTNGKKYVYRATRKGIDLIPTMVELVLWSERHLPEVKVPRERLEPLIKDKEGFIQGLRGNLLAELKMAERSHLSQAHPN